MMYIFIKKETKNLLSSSTVSKQKQFRVKPKVMMPILS